MATVETLLRKRLLTDDGLAQILARYAGAPAVFYQESPADTAEGWGKVQYPRLILYADTFTDAERNQRKALAVDVVCTSTGASPEEIEERVRAKLAGVFFTPDGGVTFSAKWRDSQIFKEAVSEREPLILGVTVNFDVHEYPCTETSDPDPIAAMNAYAEHWDEKLTVIGWSELHGIFEPTGRRPVVYFSRGQESVNRQTNTVVWRDTAIHVHLFAPTAEERVAWLEQFAQSLSLAGEVAMLDGSPMLLQDIRGDAASDEIAGQLIIHAQYGILRRPRYAHTLMKMHQR